MFLVFTAFTGRHFRPFFPTPSLPTFPKSIWQRIPIWRRIYKKCLHYRLYQDQNIMAELGNWVTGVDTVYWLHTCMLKLLILVLMYHNSGEKNSKNMYFEFFSDNCLCLLKGGRTILPARWYWKECIAFNL